MYIGLGLNKTQWSRWSKVNIINNEFFNIGHDFVGVRLDVEGNEIQDFAISLEFAKHIAMTSKTKKSHDYRNYFIECEKELVGNKLQISTTEISKQINEIVQAKIDEIENKCSNYYRPTALNKTQIATYIKGRLGINKTNDEYALVKKRILIILNARKWEDISIEVLQNSLNIIDECIDVVKKDRPFIQESMFN